MWRRKGWRRECCSEGRKVKKGKPNTEDRALSYFQEGGKKEDLIARGEVKEGGSLQGRAGREVPPPFGNKGRGGRSARVA